MKKTALKLVKKLVAIRMGEEARSLLATVAMATGKSKSSVLEHCIIMHAATIPGVRAEAMRLSAELFGVTSEIAARIKAASRVSSSPNTRNTTSGAEAGAIADEILAEEMAHVERRHGVSNRRR
jgi:hypothetical protein